MAGFYFRVRFLFSSERDVHAHAQRGIAAAKSMLSQSEMAYMSLRYGLNVVAIWLFRESMATATPGCCGRHAGLLRPPQLGEWMK